jgi:hypothetical protein
LTYITYSYAQDIGAKAGSKPIVNDLTQVNPVVVEWIVVPHNASEIVEAAKVAMGPLPIGGGTVEWKLAMMEANVWVPSILELRKKSRDAHKAFTSCRWRHKSGETVADKGCAGIMGGLPFMHLIAVFS